MKIEIKNRYKDIYTFTKVGDDILWEGNFKWSRAGWPNVYEHAYEAYCNDVETDERLTMGEFKTEVHKYDKETFNPTPISKKYGPLVVSDKTKINMVDPSGGPYLHSDTDMKWIDYGFEGMIIDYFVPHEKGYLIKIKNGGSS